MQPALRNTNNKFCTKFLSHRRNAHKWGFSLWSWMQVIASSTRSAHNTIRSLPRCCHRLSADWKTRLPHRIRLTYLSAYLHSMYPILKRVVQDSQPLVIGEVELLKTCCSESSPGSHCMLPKSSGTSTTAALGPLAKLCGTKKIYLRCTGQCILGRVDKL